MSSFVTFETDGDSIDVRASDVSAILPASLPGRCRLYLRTGLERVVAVSREQARQMLDDAEAGSALTPRNPLEGFQGGRILCAGGDSSAAG